MKENISCPLCHSKNNIKFWAMPGYKLTKCVDCQMIWDPFHLDNPLTQYEKNYFINDNPKGGYANYFEGMKINRKTFNVRLKRLAKKIPSKTGLLDLGSALGDCLLEAKSLGWKDTLGLEPSNYACAESRKRGVNAKCTTLEESDLKPNSVNVITSQDVLEHVKDPVSHLKRVYQTLKPGSWFFVVTPNVGGTWSKLLGPKWYHYKPGEHINYFTPRTIKQALSSVGFENIEVHPTCHIMSMEYVLNRCRYYFPHFFDLLLRLTKNTQTKNIAFKLHTGELEAWAQKPVK